MRETVRLGGLPGETRCQSDGEGISPNPEKKGVTLHSDPNILRNVLDVQLLLGILLLILNSQLIRWLVSEVMISILRDEAR